MTGMLDAEHRRSAAAVDRVASLLREEILRIGQEDVLIGSEDELMVRTGVSRPTLRQALRVLDYEQLLTARRGIKGGIFTRRPGVGAVAQAASTYLRAHDATLEQSSVASSIVSAELAALAAQWPSEADRAGLLAWVIEQQRGPDPDERGMLGVALEFGRRVAALSGNEPLRLFSAVLQQLAFAPYGFRLYADPKHITVTRQSHLATAKAIARGDATGANEHARARRRRQIMDRCVATRIGDRRDRIGAERRDGRRPGESIRPPVRQQSRMSEFR